MLPYPILLLIGSPNLNISTFKPQTLTSNNLINPLLNLSFAYNLSLLWLFKGAYANYHGETTVLFITVKVNMRLEVVDYNSTHAKLLMYVKMETPLGSQEFQNTTWSDLTKKSYEIQGSKLKRVYDQETYIEGFGTRKCTVYEYETSPGSLMIAYVDKETSWPIKFTLTTETTQNAPKISMDLKITETNIPGLKK